MDVTPTPKMLETMQKFTDALVGENPTKLEQSAAANSRRHARRACMDFLHNLVRLSMREGVGRWRRENGMTTIRDEVRPNRLKKVPLHSDVIQTD